MKAVAARNLVLGRPFKLLAVDDDAYCRLMVQAYGEKLGYDVIMARDGEEGVKLFEEVEPDIVLMDIMMPRMDGLDAARLIKSRQTQWAPIVFLTAKSEEGDLVTALDHGGDDFLHKPISFALFRAKMLSLQRTLLLNHQVSTQARRLRAYHDANEGELQTAKELIDRVVYSPMVPDDHFSYWLMPAKGLSGDVVAVARTPRGVLHVMLADGVGHGLSAAINVMPISPIFYKMTSRGHSLADILREMNQTIRNVLPPDRFISAILFSIDFENVRLECWNGGIPEAIIIDDAGDARHRCASRNFPLGLRAENDYEKEIETIPWRENRRIIFFSDGLVEAVNREGALFGRERLLHCLAEAPLGEEIAFTRKAVVAHMAGFPHADDISLAVVRLDYAPPPVRCGEVAPCETSEWLSDTWCFEMAFGAAELRAFDPVPIVMAALDQFRIPKTMRGRLFVVLSELACNAFEHGLLGLDSMLKDDPDAELYYEERARRLKVMTSGEVRVRLDVSAVSGTRCLRLRVTDTGAGFDVAALPDAQTALNSYGRYGRGIPLVRGMVSQLVFNEAGNSVEASLPL